MPEPIQRNSISFPLTTRYNSASSSPSPGTGAEPKTIVVPPINKIPADYPIGPAPGKIEKLYISNNRSILNRFNPRTGYSNGLFRFGPSQPFVWFNPNEGNSGTNAIKKYDSRFFPLGSALQDVIRVGKFLVSGPGVIFNIKQLVLQNLQPFNETALYNPAETLISSFRATTLGLYPRVKRHIDLSSGFLGALASVVGFSVPDQGKSIPKGSIGAGSSDTDSNSPLSKQSIGAGKGMLRAKTASSGYTSFASRWGGNASKTSFLKAMAASVFPSLISVKQPPGTKYKADEGAYGMMVLDNKEKLSSLNTLTGINIPLNQIWIAGADTIRKKKETPRSRTITYVDKTNQQVSNSVSGPTINGVSTGFTIEKDQDDIEKYGKSVGITAYRKNSDSDFKFSVMLINYKKFLDKTSTFLSKMDGPPIDLTNAEDKVIIKPQEDFYKKYGFSSTPFLASVLTFESIPTRRGKVDDKAAPYLVDNTYSKRRKDNSNEGVLKEFRTNLDAGKIGNVPSLSNDVNEPINTTLALNDQDRINKERTEKQKQSYSQYGFSDTPKVAKSGTIVDIPKREGGDLTRDAYLVDGTYVKNVIDNSNEGVLKDIRTNLDKDKIGKVPTRTNSTNQPINATLEVNSNDPINKAQVEEKDNFYKQRGFSETPKVAQQKQITDIPERGTTNRPPTDPVNVAGTYSNVSREEGPESVLQKLKQNLEGGKLENVPSAKNFINEPINATLALNDQDRINQEISDNQKKVYTDLGFSDTPEISKIKKLNQIPTREGTGDLNRDAYLVDGTYSATRKDDGINSNLVNIRRNLEDGKISDTVSTSTIDIKGDPTNKNNATLQLKKDDIIIVDRIASLRSVIDKIKSSGYNVAFNNVDTRVLSSPDATIHGIQKLTARNIVDNKYTKDYATNSELLDGLEHSRRDSKKFAGARHGDELNKLTILGSGRDIVDETDVAGWDVYDPVRDDLVAFYFFDVVNERYIPFRATVTGINDSFQADWNNYKYIGRADKLYTYEGMSRQMSFTFKVFASSIKELLPMWKRVNYLCGLTMPANYTTATSQGDGTESQFAVPAFVKLTLGDMYKEQPILINRVGLSIPEGTAWETSSENRETNWSYLNGIISWPSSDGKYAQFPREVEISMDITVLQKERPVVGSANFGNAPRDQQNNAVIAGDDNKFSKQLITYVQNYE